MRSLGGYSCNDYSISQNVISSSGLQNYSFYMEKWMNKKIYITIKALFLKQKKTCSYKTFIKQKIYYFQREKLAIQLYRNK